MFKVITTISPINVWVVPQDVKIAGMTKNRPNKFAEYAIPNIILTPCKNARVVLVIAKIVIITHLSTILTVINAFQIQPSMIKINVSTVNLTAINAHSIKQLKKFIVLAV